MPRPVDPAYTATPRSSPKSPITRRDVIAGTSIAVAMAIGFSLLSHGTSLVVTFVPAVVAAWLLFVWLHRARVPLPTVAAFLPAFLCVLAVQLLHFAEEYVTGFRTEFPALYGAAPFPESLFVGFNMVTYAVVAITCVVALTTTRRFLIMPALFFVLYGAIGNAVAHTWWSIQTHGYFPGFFTAQLHWIGGAWLLFLLVRDRRRTAVVIAAFALVLVPLLTIAAVGSAA